MSSKDIHQMLQYESDDGDDVDDISHNDDQSSEDKYDGTIIAETNGKKTTYLIGKSSCYGRRVKLNRRLIQ